MSVIQYIETKNFRKVKASLFEIRIEKCKKGGFLMQRYLERTFNLGGAMFFP